MTEITTLSSLQNVFDSFAYEVDAIASSFSVSDSCGPITGYTVKYEPHGDGCVVSLWDAWNRFLRSLVMTCSSGPALSLSGRTYTPQHPRSEDEVIAAVKAAGIKAPGDEPNWFNVRLLSDIMQIIQLFNGSHITAAVGASSIRVGAGITMRNPLAEVREIRNFIAHKNRGTLARAQSYMNPAADVHAHIWQKVAGGTERFIAWTDCLTAIAESACM